MYPLVVFRTVVKETMQEVVNLRLGHAASQVVEQFDGPEALDMIKQALRTSRIGALFEADRAAARLADAGQDKDLVPSAFPRNARL